MIEPFQFQAENNMNDLHDLELMLRAQTPIIIVESLEELRMLQFLVRVSGKLPLPFYKWTVTEGVSRLDLDYGQQKDTENPQLALKHIKDSSAPGYFVMLDFHPFLDDPIHIRLIKEIALNFDNMNKYLVFISYSLEMPRELQHLCARFSIQLPTRSAIKKLIKEEALAWKSRNGKNLKVQTNIPILEKLAKDPDLNFVLAKVDVDENPGLSMAYQIPSIPAVIAFLDGEAVDDRLATNI